MSCAGRAQFVEGVVHLLLIVVQGEFLMCTVIYSMDVWLLSCVWEVRHVWSETTEGYLLVEWWILSFKSINKVDD